jgi:hypothetical protein
MEANENRKFDRDGRNVAPAAPAESIPDQIARLDQLRQQGVLTQAEFDAKKQQLLDRMLPSSIGCSPPRSDVALLDRM